jgi:hypothetical protein
MNLSAFQRRSVFVVLSILLVFSGCAPSATQITDQLLGRWQRVAEGPYMDAPFPSAKYLEFRPDGQLVELDYDAKLQQAWMLDVRHYAIAPSGRVEIDGYCWRGSESFPCTRAYVATRTDNKLNFTDEQAQPQPMTIQYRRIADFEPELPPMAPLPFASPTPVP